MSLTTTITESLTLEGSDCGSGVSITQSNVVYYLKKVIPISASNGGTSLYTCSSDGTSADFDYDKVKYARITNLSATTKIYMAVKVKTGTAHYIEFVIAPLGSFIINSHNAWISNDTTISEGVVKEVRVQAASIMGVGELFVGYEA